MLSHLQQWLPLALQATAPCSPCAPQQDFARIITGLDATCRNPGLPVIEAQPNYNAVRDGDAAHALEQACAIIADGMTRLGPPQPNAAWLSVAAQARAAADQYVMPTAVPYTGKPPIFP
jgi:hypothetical protein